MSVCQSVCRSACVCVCRSVCVCSSVVTVFNEPCTNYDNYEIFYQLLGYGWSNQYMPYYQYPWGELCGSGLFSCVNIVFFCCSNDARVRPLHVCHGRKKWLPHKDKGRLFNRYCCIKATLLFLHHTECDVCGWGGITVKL